MLVVVAVCIKDGCYFVDFSVSLKHADGTRSVAIADHVRTGGACGDDVAVRLEGSRYATTLSHHALEVPHSRGVYAIWPRSRIILSTGGKRFKFAVWQRHAPPDALPLAQCLAQFCCVW